MISWPDLKKLINAVDLAGIQTAVSSLTTAERRSLVDPLTTHERQLREGRWIPQETGSALSLAGAGVLSGSATLAPWLVRNGLFSPLGDARPTLVDQVVAVLRAREVTWLPDLAHRLAQRIRVDDRLAAPLFQLVNALATVEGIDPPVTDGYVYAWAEHHQLTDVPQLVAELRHAPALSTVVKHLFEVASVGTLLADDNPYAPSSEYGITSALVHLSAEGVLDRGELLDDCLARLQRGGRVSEVRGFLHLYDLLEPSLDEVTARVRDYAVLLPDAHSTVAGMAQRELLRVANAGRLDLDVLLDASRAVLTRSEKKLVRAQLTALDAAIRQDPSRANQVLPVVAVAFAHDAADLQQRAFTLACKHSRHGDAPVLAELAEAAADLPTDLRAQAAEAFGAAPAAAAPPSALPAAPPPQELPPPITSADELAAELAALYAGFPDSIDPVAFERVLAGLVTHAHHDRAELATALQPFLARHGYLQPGFDDWRAKDHWVTPGEFDGLAAIIAAALAPATGDPASPFPAPEDIPGQADWAKRLAERPLPGPHLAVLWRLREIAVGLAFAPRPLLVSTPTTTTGQLDPAELLTRLTRAADEGWQPWPLDLELALLRLPAAVDPAIAGHARRLGTPAAEQLANWLDNGGLPSLSLAREIDVHHTPDIAHQRAAGTLAQESAVAGEASPAPAPALDTLAGLLSAPAQSEQWRRYGYSSIYWLACWPSLLPNHREVIAAHLLPQFFLRTHSGRGDGPLLPLLAEADGTSGPATLLAMAYGLSARDATDRAAAVDALLILASRDQLDWTAFGADIGALAARGDVLLGRIVPALRELARAGAAQQVWSAVATALPPVLSPTVERPPQRLADLLALAVELADAAEPGITIPGLAEFAARGGTSRQATEANRLHNALSAR